MNMMNRTRGFAWLNDVQLLNIIKLVNISCYTSSHCKNEYIIQSKKIVATDYKQYY